jgi:hypothetical protein
VINRGNGKTEVLHKAEDYYRFTEMMHESWIERIAARLGLEATTHPRQTPEVAPWVGYGSKRVECPLF